MVSLDHMILVYGTLLSSRYKTTRFFTFNHYNSRLNLWMAAFYNENDMGWILFTLNCNLTHMYCSIKLLSGILRIGWTLWTGSEWVTERPMSPCWRNLPQNEKAKTNINIYGRYCWDVHICGYSIQAVC